MRYLQWKWYTTTRPLVVVGLLLMVSACGGGGSSSSDSSVVPEASELSEITPYISNSPYAPLLKACALAENSSESCLLSDLPLLVEDASILTVDRIMARVLVSHAWMGLRFRQVLETMPPEILMLFGSVAAIIIDDDVRPSSYLASTSTIYLDPAYLWLSNIEKVTISTEEDFRSDFANSLSFVSLSRYVDGFSYAWDYYSLSGNEERQLADIRLRLAELLLHELMHANDFFPPREIPYLSLNQTIFDAAQKLQGTRISLQLDQQYPLQSTLLTSLAGVMYFGDTATSELRDVTAEQVGNAMELDSASDDYAYSTIREDVAMLFSEAMMKYLFNIDRDIGYAPLPQGSSPFCDDYIIDWGVRGRIRASQVKIRAQYVIGEVYPGSDFSLFFQQLPPPIDMRTGEDWCENLALF